MRYSPDSVIGNEFRAQPSDLRMITIDGDFMEPLLASGDRILIDTSRRMPMPPWTFAIWDGMGFLVKRTEHEPNSESPKGVIKLMNPEYNIYERDAE